MLRSGGVEACNDTINVATPLLTTDWLSTHVVNSFSCSTGMVLLRFTTLAIMPPAAVWEE